MEFYSEFMCGMRHPTTGLSEDDLSRLTNGSSSSSSSSSSSASTTPSHDQPTTIINHGHHQKQTTTTKFCSPATTTSLNDNGSTLSTTETTTLTKAEINLTSLNNEDQTTSSAETQNEHVNNLKNNVVFNSSYLPEFIDPLEWQKSRKRKERLDSTSSITQDRKLVRSNSEEIIAPPEENPGDDVNNLKKADGVEIVVREAIRRVSSEDFKRSYNEDFHQEKTFVSDENDSLLANRPHSELFFSPGAKDIARRARLESSPSRSNRVSPNREIRSKNNGDECELEHERRRSSERFCKSRAPPGRKSGVMKKSGKFLPTKMRGDENTYKYDLSAMKYERRGFVSKIKVEERLQRKEEAADGQRNDYNDNNLIDFHIIRSEYGNNTTATPTSLSSQQQQQQQQTQQQPESNISTTTTKTTAEALPWDCSIPEDQTPVLSRRFAAVRHPDSIDIAAKLSKIMPYPQQFHKTPNSMMADDDAIEPIINPYWALTHMENAKTREVMQQVIPSIMSFQTPEERLKQVNKRLVSLKKKAVQLEEQFEKKNGYRPSQAEKLNDKHIKNILGEISKLKKEKHELKSDPMAALGLKVSGGMDAEKKLEKIQSTLNEIEQNLADKREDGNRSETLDELTPDQLVQEKTAVQHGLLFYESLYGRPSTKEERDAARPLYDRYRMLKRMVSRSVTLSGNTSGAPELPTILEHEAMVFEAAPHQHSSNSTDSTTSPSESSTLVVSESNSSAASTDSTPDNKVGGENEDGEEEEHQHKHYQEPQQHKRHQHESLFGGENIHQLSTDKLWEHLDKAREEKKLLKRTLREYETVFEEQNGRKMLKNDRKSIEDTYAQYKEAKAKARLLQALIKKHISR
ncbi:protein FAM13A isoform X2 [Episyrphus balteatus]|uniref:protein FAM13A isoform X2 n=1 Tax=Episyrphus balteatus TaxID=286459 RepID=UPI002486683C|nr:protein FAM13A isoform X2 [Episyrphus balteatus]